MLDIILIVISALCMIAGLAGCILPFLPGPPIAYVGLIILHFTDKVQYSTTQLIVWLLIAAGTDEEKEPVCLLYHRNEAGFVYIIIVFAADDCEVHHTVRQTLSVGYYIFHWIHLLSSC